jgi:hypothetical protein
MPWTGVRKETRQESNGQRSTQVVLTAPDGVTIYTPWITNDGTTASLRRGALAFIASIEATNENTPGTSIDCTPDAPASGPTAAQIARAVWFNKYARLNHQLGLKSSGIPFPAQQMTALDNSIATLRSELAADALPSYALPD